MAELIKTPTPKAWVEAMKAKRDYTLNWEEFSKLFKVSNPNYKIIHTQNVVDMKGRVVGQTKVELEARELFEVGTNFITWDMEFLDSRITLFKAAHNSAPSIGAYVPKLSPVISREEVAQFRDNYSEEQGRDRQ